MIQGRIWYVYHAFVNHITDCNSACNEIIVIIITHQIKHGFANEDDTQKYLLEFENKPYFTICMVLLLNRQNKRFYQVRFTVQTYRNNLQLNYKAAHLSRCIHGQIMPFGQV